MKRLIFFTLLISCGPNHEVHDRITCLVQGKNCPASVEYVDRLHNEQQAELEGIDARIDDAMEILGRDRLEIDEVINLCDNDSEILIRLDGELIAYNNRRGGYLDFLDPGRYITTDGFGCRFTVTEDLEVIY